MAGLYNISKGKLQNCINIFSSLLNLRLNLWNIVVEQTRYSAEPKQKSWMDITENAFSPSTVRRQNGTEHGGGTGFFFPDTPPYTPATFSQIYSHMRALAQFAPLPEILFPHILVIGPSYHSDFYLNLISSVTSVATHPNAGPQVTLCFHLGAYHGLMLFYLFMIYFSYQLNGSSA